jgi:hypothetical protein
MIIMMTIKVKYKVPLSTLLKHTWEFEVELYLFLTSALDESE